MIYLACTWLVSISNWTSFELSLWVWQAQLSPTASVDDITELCLVFFDGYSRHDKLTRNIVYAVQTNAISSSETASAVTQLSRSGTLCPLSGSRCGCSSISHAVAPQQHQSRSCHVLLIHAAPVRQHQQSHSRHVVHTMVHTQHTTLLHPSISNAFWAAGNRLAAPVWQQHQSRSRHTVAINNTQSASLQQH